MRSNGNREKPPLAGKRKILTKTIEDASEDFKKNLSLLSCKQQKSKSSREINNLKKHNSSKERGSNNCNISNVVEQLKQKMIDNGYKIIPSPSILSNRKKSCSLHSSNSRNLLSKLSFTKSPKNQNYASKFMIKYQNQDILNTEALNVENNSEMQVGQKAGRYSMGICGGCSSKLISNKNTHISISSLLSCNKSHNNLTSKQSLTTERAKSKSISRQGNLCGYFESICKKFKGNKQDSRKGSLSFRQETQANQLTKEIEVPSELIDIEESYIKAESDIKFLDVQSKNKFQLKYANGIDKENINPLNIQLIRNTKVKTLFELNKQNKSICCKEDKDELVFPKKKPLSSIESSNQVNRFILSPRLVSNSNYQLEIKKSLKDQTTRLKPNLTIQKHKIGNNDTVKNLLKLRCSFSKLPKQTKKEKYPQNSNNMDSPIEVANSNNDLIQKLSFNETNSRRGRNDRKKDRYKIKPIGVKEIIKYS